MKILLVHNYYRLRGGEDAAFERECALLKEAGHETRLWTKQSRDYTSLKDQWRVAVDLPYSAESKAEFAEVLGRFRPEIVHCHNIFPVITASIYEACLEHKVPVVQTLHNFRMRCASALLLRDGVPCEICWRGSAWPSVRYGCYQDSRLKSVPVARMIERHKADRAFEKVNRFIALSEFSKSKFVEAGIAPERIDVKPNFVKAPAPQKRRKSNTFALFVGRLSEEKGIKTMADAWRKLDIPLKVAGTGPLEPMLRDQPNVELLGQKNAAEVAALMREAAFLVFPTICYENFPLVLAEAFSQGLPVLGSSIGSVKEIVDSGTGVLFAAKDPLALAEGARLLWRFPGHRIALSEGGRRKFEALYTPEKNLELLLGTYKKAQAEPAAAQRP